jgi:hypothetical protein
LGGQRPLAPQVFRRVVECLTQPQNVSASVARA